MKLFRREQAASRAVHVQEINERHNLSQQIFFRREAMGWPQGELAERCNTTQAQIANIEAGRVNPTLNTLVRLAAVFGCLAHDLLRPLDRDGEWHRPETRDWARWTSQERGERDVVVRVELEFPSATGAEVDEYAYSRHPAANDTLALTA